MNEQDYERMVERLEQRYDNELLDIAVQAVEAIERHGGSEDDARDEAKAAIEVVLFGNLDWEHVKATDISDVAYETAERAWSTTRAWNQS